MNNQTENQLKIFISVDMEGISGIVHQSQTGINRDEYEKGRSLMAMDVNAAIQGILQVSQEAHIVVSDAHWHMRNIRPEDLHESAILVRGSPKSLTQMEGIDRRFDAALFIGYHAKRGTWHGILDHTISGRVIDTIIVNGREVGETALNAAIAGYYNVPLVFLSGDLAVTREAQALIPNVVTVAVKEAVSRTAAKCLHPKQARERIMKEVTNAIYSRDRIKPFSVKPPIEMKVKFVHSLMVDAVEFMPFIERVDGRTTRFTFDDYIKAFRALRASISIASTMSS